MVRDSLDALLVLVRDLLRLVRALEPREVLLVEPPRLLLEFRSCEVPGGGEVRLSGRSPSATTAVGRGRTGGMSPGSSRRCRRACRRRTWRTAPGSQTGPMARAGSTPVWRTGSAGRSTSAWDPEVRINSDGPRSRRNALLRVERLGHVREAGVEDLVHAPEVVVPLHR